jgi:SAM-dependent methyltransferase
MTPLTRLAAFLQRVQGDVYPEDPSPLHEQITRTMVQALLARHPLPAGARVLDVGCGQGLALELFGEAGLDATGITLGSDAAVCQGKGLNVREADFADLDFDDASFDLVWARHALEHSVVPAFLLSEFHRLLKPGGVLYVEVPAPDTACAHETNPNHHSVLGKRMWLALIGRAGFAGVEGKDLQLTTAAGPDLYWAFMARKP